MWEFAGGGGGFTRGEFDWGGGICRVRRGGGFSGDGGGGGGGRISSSTVYYL